MMTHVIRDARQQIAYSIQRTGKPPSKLLLPQVARPLVMEHVGQIYTYSTGKLSMPDDVADSMVEKFFDLPVEFTNWVTAPVTVDAT